MKHILVVEDDKNIQQLLKEELTEDGYGIDIVSDGREAMSFLKDAKRQKPDLIILDLRMPRMDGFETMGNIIKSKHETRVIVHTAYSSYRDDVMAMAADAYIEKSHDLTKLKEKIKELLGE
jgi:two-component system, response regulator, stage 0 sporulation protein F